MKYQKVLLKISGETFAAEEGGGISKEKLENFTAELIPVLKAGVQVALVIGGGNFWRERDFRNLGLKNTLSDQVGMLATVMNALVFGDFLKNQGIGAKVLAARGVAGVVKDYCPAKAEKALAKGQVAILAGGTGNPFFTTDSAAVLRALELNCDVILKGTKVDGVYSADPQKDPAATKYDTITYEEALAKNLKVLDQTAFSLAREKRPPLIVFNIFDKGALERAVKGDKIGTLVF